MFLFLCQIFDFNNKPAEEEEDDKDLSDSEDSVYSGLEDSGSDSEDDDNDEDVEEEELDDEEPDEPQQVEFNLLVWVTCVSPAAVLIDYLCLIYLQTQEVEEEKSGVTAAAEQEKKEDEYEHDSSDEEVRPGVLLGSLTFHLCLCRCWDVF